MTDQNAEALKKQFQDMLVQMGKNIAGQFHVNAQDVTPNAAGQFSKVIAPMIEPIKKKAETVFKDLLNDNFNSAQLTDLISSISKPFIDGLKTVSGQMKDKSPLELGIQLLKNFGIPLIKSFMEETAKHKAQEPPVPKTPRGRRKSF